MAAADLQTVNTLASILIRAGAVAGDRARHQPRMAELHHLRPHGRLDPVKLVPNDQQPASRYLVPDDRDFFAVYRRLRQESPLVPFK